MSYSVNNTNAAKNTTATFTKAGTYNFLVTVTNGQYSTTSGVQVTVQQASQGVRVTPGQFFVPVNTTQQFTASVVDEFNSPISGAPVTYLIQSGGGTINSTGLYSAPATTGTTIIKATSGSSTATANVVPPNHAPTVATGAASGANPVTGTTTPLSVLGADDNGEGNLTYLWFTLGAPPATVANSVNGTNAAKSTVATFTANGQYNFLVTIRDSNGLTTTSSVTVTVNTFVPVVVDGTKDGRYGKPLAVQNVATDHGNGNLGAPAAPYSQLAAAYGVIDPQTGKFNLFLAGSLNLNNASLDLLIDSVPGQGAANLAQLANRGPWGSSPFSQVTLDSDFRPDHVFSANFGGGQYLDYFNFNTGVAASNVLTDPATGTATSSGGVPLFSERVNNAAQGSVIAANTGGPVTTGAEFSFDLAGLGYTTANLNAGVPILVQALISYGSHYQTTDQSLAPYNATAQQRAKGTYFDGTFDESNDALFPGKQYVSVGTPAGPSGPTVATHASAGPSPATGNFTNLSVLGGSTADEGTLSYLWTTTGTPPAPVSFSVNNTNAAKNTTATFTKAGTYNFLVTIRDAGNLTTTGSVTVTAATGGGSAGTGLNVTYDDNVDFTGPSVTRADPTVNFDFGTGSPDPGIDADTFSARWTGQVAAVEAGNYTFRVTGDDGLRLYVGGQLVIDAFHDQAPTAYTSAAVAFAAGECKDVRLEYYEQAYGATIKLEWQRPGQSTYAVVPQARLYTTLDTTNVAGGTATSSGDNGPNGEGAAHAFDNNACTKALVYVNPSAYLQYDYAGSNAYVVTNYTLTSANDAPDCDPSAFRLLGSNDGGANWTTLDTRTGVGFTARGHSLNFTVAAGGAFQLHRLRIDAVANPAATNLAKLADLDLYGSLA